MTILRARTRSVHGSRTVVTRRLDSWELTKTLFASWKEWAETAGERAGTRKRFVQALESRGFRSRRKHDGRGIEGLSTKP